MIAKNLGEAFTQTFNATSRIAPKVYGLYVLTLIGAGTFSVIGASAVGTPLLTALVFGVFAALFISASWRRRNDVGLVGKSAMVWLAPAILIFFGLVLGSPVRQDVPEVPVGLGDAGIFALFTPEVGQAASATFSNWVNEMLFGFFCVLMPIVFVAILGIREAFMSKLPSVETK